MSAEGFGAHRARKRFGQNFLIDDAAIHKIVAALDAGPDDHVVEIGPGQGALSFPLLRTGCQLTVIEIDRDLAARLRVQGAQLGAERFRLIEGDALEVRLSDLPAPFKLAGNLPYNISTPLLFHFLSHASALERIVVMLQKEVVERMAAAPGSKTYGRLSVMLQARCRVEPLFLVPPESFRPVPAVDSAVVRLWPQGIDPTVQKPLERIVRAAFGERRKQLGNALRGVVDEPMLTAVGLSRTARAEEVPVATYIELARALRDTV